MFQRTLRIAVSALLAVGVAFGSVALAHDGGRRSHARRSDRPWQWQGHDGHGTPHGNAGGCERFGSYSPLDEQYAETSMHGDVFEVKGGELAQHDTSTPIVDKLGARLVSDHTKSYQEMASEAREHGIEVPSSPEPSQEWELHAVSSLTGHEFDVWYSELEVKDHTQDIEETKNEIRNGCDGDIRKLAAEDLPTLEEHLHLSEQALAAVKSSSASSSSRQR